MLRPDDLDLVVAEDLEDGALGKFKEEHRLPLRVVLARGDEDVHEEVGVRPLRDEPRLRLLLRDEARHGVLDELHDEPAPERLAGVPGILDEGDAFGAGHGRAFYGAQT